MMRTSSALCTLLLAVASLAQDIPNPDFDFDSGNAATEVIIPYMRPWVIADISPAAGDASLIFRYTALFNNAIFDALAPFHETAVGVYSRFERIPIAERTTRNVNMAIFYSVRYLLLDYFPLRRNEIDTMYTEYNLDPYATGDSRSPVGIALEAGEAVVESRRRDGYNSLGDFAGKRSFHPTNYYDTTSYVASNSPYELTDAGRWQPQMQVSGVGLYKTQQFVTPQYGLVEPYSYADPNEWPSPRPDFSNPQNAGAYQKQADDVLSYSARLTTQTKLEVELFDNKLRSLGQSAVQYGAYKNLSTIELMQMNFLVNMGGHDAGVWVWNEKRRWDAVRPSSAIKHLYRGQFVQAWGGPGEGTVELPGEEFTPYVPVADHPEYPGATACFCNTQAQSLRRYYGNDDLVHEEHWAAGESRIEPGITPEQDYTLRFTSWTDFASRCAQSRVWGGLHFQAATDYSSNTCARFGDMAFEYWESLMQGTAPVRPPAQGRPVPEWYNNEARFKKYPTKSIH